MCVPERLRLGVPGDSVVVLAGARGPGARGRGGRCTGSRVASPARPLRLSTHSLGPLGVQPGVCGPRWCMGAPWEPPALPVGVTPRDARLCARVCPGDVTARKLSWRVFLVKTGINLLLLVLAHRDVRGGTTGLVHPRTLTGCPFLDGGMGVGNSAGVSISPSHTSVVGREKRLLRVE